MRPDAAQRRARSLRDGCPSGGGSWSPLCDERRCRRARALARRGRAVIGARVAGPVADTAVAERSRVAGVARRRREKALEWSVRIASLLVLLGVWQVLGM